MYCAENAAAIDGFFIDDTWSDDGFGIGHPGAGDLNGSEVQDVGLTHQDLVDLQGNWSANLQIVKDAIVAHDGFLWQDMVCVGDDGATPVKCEGYNGTQAGPPITKDSCATRLRQACQLDSVYQTGALFYGFKDQGNRGPLTVPLEDFGNDLVNFLLVRGNYSWLGYSWVGCSHVYPRPPALDTDYGQPLGLCRETVPGTSGIFVREWSEANVSMDCNRWQGTIDGTRPSSAEL